MTLRFMLSTILLLAGTQTLADPSGFAFTPAGESMFEFDTGQMQGTVRLDGAYHGVSRLVDTRTGKQVIDP